MAAEIESILLEENVYPTIKLEAIESDHIDSVTCPSPANEIKIGEIFCTSIDRLKFVCIHCFDEFVHLTEFTIHIEGHLQAIQLNGIGDDDDGLEVIDVKPLLEDYSPGIVDEAGNQLNYAADCLPKSRKKYKTKKKAKWKCPDCDRYFEQRCLLKRHYDVAHEMITFCCQICQTVAKHKQNIKRHMKTFHPNDDEMAYTVNARQESADAVATSTKLVTRRESVLDGTAAKLSDDDRQQMPVGKSLIKSKLATQCDRTHRQISYLCNVCKLSTERKQNMERHIRAKHPGDDESAYTVQFGNERATQDRAIPRIGRKSKKSKVRDRKPFKCSDCDRIFKQPSMLKRHYHTHHSRDIHLCSICKMSIKHKHNMLRHMRTMHPYDDENAYTIISNADREEAAGSVVPLLTPQQQPDIGESGAKPKPSGKKIKIKRNASGKFECTECPKSYLHICLLRRHRDNVHTSTVFKCKICNQTINYLTNMYRHMRTKHPNHSNAFTKVKRMTSSSTEPLSIIPTQFECYLCRSQETSFKEIAKHFRKMHLPYTSYYYNTKFRLRKCNKCGEQFNGISMFEKHKRWHKGQLNYRPHQCHLCAKAFVEQHQLKRHLQRHAAIKDKTCTLCNKSVSQFYMKEHLRRHTDQRKVQCTVCGNFYSDSGKLSRHMRTHTGELPYKCEYCGKRFTQSSSLVVHKRSHTGDYLHYCKPCEKGFGARRELKKHNFRVHGMEAESEGNLQI